MGRKVSIDIVHEDLEQDICNISFIYHILDSLKLFILFAGILQLR